MSEKFPRGKTANVGASTIGMGEAPDYTALDLAATAGRKALQEANLSLPDVDALFV